MDEHIEPNSPDQTAPPPVSYSRDQKPTWNVFGKFFALFSNRTTALAGVLVLVLGVGAGIIAVQRSTETRQHAAAIISPQGPCYPAGDVNVDGKVDAVDAQLVLKYVAGQQIIGTFNQKNADVDRDGKITSADALKIQRYIVGLEPSGMVCSNTPIQTPTPAASTPPQGPCYPIGDANSDGKVDAADSQLILRYVAGMTTEINQQNADVDGVSGITSVDSLKVQRYNAGLETTFPICRNLQPTRHPTKISYPTPTTGPYPILTPAKYYSTPTKAPLITPWSATPVPAQ